MAPFAVIITGPPGAGKSTLAKAVAKDLGLPLLIKDDIKDAAFDVLGWSDRAWSKKVGGLSYAVMYRLLEAQLELGLSVVSCFSDCTSLYWRRILRQGRFVGEA